MLLQYTASAKRGQSCDVGMANVSRSRGDVTASRTAQMQQTNAIVVSHVMSIMHSVIIIGRYFTLARISMQSLCFLITSDLWKMWVIQRESFFSVYDCPCSGNYKQLFLWVISSDSVGRCVKWLVLSRAYMSLILKKNCPKSVRRIV